MSTYHDLMNFPIRSPKEYHLLPDALAVSSDLIKKLTQFRLIVFLDYDGTITPIMPHPEQAIISEEMRQVILNLSQVTPAGIVSGRDKHNIQKLLNLPNLYYIGNHGFDIEGPPPDSIHYEVGIEYLPILKKCYRELQSNLSKIPGLQFEPKRLTDTIHYRFTAEKDVDLLFKITRHTVDNYPQLKISTGKKVLEIRPNVDWDKGKAVQWLAGILGFNQPNTRILYLGDDLTDEDAFRILPNHAIGILVGNHSDQTYAQYHLEDPEQVKIFLKNLTQNILNATKSS